MIADDFSAIALRLKQIEQKTIESEWDVRFRDEAELSRMIAQQRQFATSAGAKAMNAQRQFEASNVEFVQ